MIDLDALQAAAEAATPGPWVPGDTVDWDGTPQKSVTAAGKPITWDDHSGDVFTPTDATFIAAANPAVVLELVAAHRAALARIARVEALHQPDSVLSDYCEECSDFGTDSHPVGEFFEYPCATVRALTEGEPDAD